MIEDVLKDIFNKLDLIDAQIKEINDSLKKDQYPSEPSDYCQIGMSHCSNCGWTNDYPKSGCPVCHRSFVE